MANRIFKEAHLWQDKIRKQSQRLKRFCILPIFLILRTIRAFAEIEESGARYLIVGLGELETKLKKLVLKLGLQDQHELRKSSELHEVILEMLLERLAQKYGKIKRYWLLRKKIASLSYIQEELDGENEYEVIYEIYNLQKIRKT